MAFLQILANHSRGDRRIRHWIHKNETPSRPAPVVRIEEKWTTGLQLHNRDAVHFQLLRWLAVKRVYVHAALDARHLRLHLPGGMFRKVGSAELQRLLVHPDNRRA